MIAFCRPGLPVVTDFRRRRHGGGRPGNVLHSVRGLVLFSRPDRASTKAATPARNSRKSCAEKFNETQRLRRFDFMLRSLLAAFSRANVCSM